MPQGKKIRLGWAATVGILLFLLLFGGGRAVYAEPADGQYKLSFTVTREDYVSAPGAGMYENLSADYRNHWMYEPPNDVVDSNTGNLKSFSINFNLYVDEATTPASTQTMSYDASRWNWHTRATFTDIAVPYKKLEVEYYTDDQGKDIANYLLSYDLYLKRDDQNKQMILSLPKIKRRVADPEGLYKILGLQDVSFDGEAYVDPFAGINKIYLNGTAGSDDNDGIAPDKAVKSFQKARDIAVEHTNIMYIVVTGETEIEGEISTPAEVLRGPDYTGYLFRVAPGKTATLSNITISGNVKNGYFERWSHWEEIPGEGEDLGPDLEEGGETDPLNPPADPTGNPTTNDDDDHEDESGVYGPDADKTTAEKALITVTKGSTLNIESGTTLKNNKLGDDELMGGAVYVSGGTLNMNGGTIKNNEATYGGGVYLRSGTMNFTGGLIERNKAIPFKDNNGRYASGGGICAGGNATINMSGDALVSDNVSAESGGGISLGISRVNETNVLHMSGGTIRDNRSGSSGGGLFIQAGYLDGGPSKAYITGGEIINNEMRGNGKQGSHFGGGGIYVNGASKKVDERNKNGELYLANVLITDNYAKQNGAGYAACPITDTKFYGLDGGAIYDNKRLVTGEIADINKATKPSDGEDTDPTGGSQPSKPVVTTEDDLYILCFLNGGDEGQMPHYNGKPAYELSERMLGGTPYNWKNLDNSLLPLEKYKGQLTESGQNLTLHTDKKGNKQTEKATKVIIRGNKSETRGGGIGSNGTVVIGKKSIDIPVEKRWNDQNNENKLRPQSITVKLLADGQEVTSEVLNEGNQWKTTFKDLPKTDKAGETIAYTVEEVKVPEGYTAEITGDLEKGFTVTNTHKPKTPSEEPSTPSEESSTTPPTPSETPSTPPETPSTPPEFPPRPEEPPVTPPTPPEEPGLPPVEPQAPCPPQEVAKKPAPARKMPPDTGDSGVLAYSLALLGAGSVLAWIRRRKDQA